MKSTYDIERSRIVANAVSQAIASAFKLGTTGVVATLDACRQSLLAGSTEDSERLEVTRRIAEAKVSILFERPTAVDEFYAAWRQLESAGYSSNEREASMLVYFVKYRSLIGSPDDLEKRQALQRLNAVIERMSAAGDTNLATHFRKVHDRLSTASE